MKIYHSHFYRAHKVSSTIVIAVTFFILYEFTAWNVEIGVFDVAEQDTEVIFSLPNPWSPPRVTSSFFMTVYCI